MTKKMKGIAQKVKNYKLQKTTNTMHHERRTQSEQRGMRILQLLEGPRNLEGTIRSHTTENISLTDENGKHITWDSFVTFPSELSASFPGSVISPGILLRTLGEDRGNVNYLLGGDREGKTVFEHKDEKGNFELSVLHGSTSEYAMKLMSLANQGFKDESVRAQYQQAMIEGMAPALRNEKHPPSYGLRIHDDCLASGDSVLSYLELQMKQGNENILKKGVEVVIDGAATAQSILLLRAYAKKHEIPLHITAGYVAYGLSKGVVTESGARQHANYITFPGKVLRMLPVEQQLLLKKFMSEDGNIYVVGDMGDAEQGVGQEVIDQLRQQTGDTTYCTINDIRKDPHGNHPNKGTISRMDGPLNQDIPNDVYFARGGYVPFAEDEAFNPNFNFTNKVVLTVSRKWTKELGYGATFRPTDN